MCLEWDTSVGFYLEPSFIAENLDYEATIKYTNNNGTGFQIILVRKITRVVVETIGPTTILVLMSSVSNRSSIFFNFKKQYSHLICILRL